MKRNLLLTLLFLACTAGAAAQSAADLDKLVNQIKKESGMQHASLAVCVYDLQQAHPLYSHNADASMVPASVQKLLTTATAFSQLGSDFRFTTLLGISGDIDRDGVLHGNIYIIGGGDPLLGSYRYRQTSADTLFDGWLKALKKKGIRKVDGRVCYNTTIYDDQPLHNTWQWGDVGNYYGAGVSGLNFHENMFFVYFNPGKKVGYPASAVRVEPKHLNVHGVCEVTTGPENSGDNVVIYGTPTSPERLYRGTVPLGKNDFSVRGAMPNPARSCADLFATYLRTHGISISSNSMQIFTNPENMRVVLEYSSPEYYTIAQYTNLTSNNIYAEAIFKQLGYRRFGTGSFEGGARAVTDYLRDRNVEAGGVRVVDGSGLSVQNHLTADFLCRFLYMVNREPYAGDFMHTLAVVGQSGTARNLLPQLPKNVTVQLKTGTMNGVKAYAGYITNARGQRRAFALLCNNYECSDAAVRDKLNKLLLRIATTL